MSNIFDRFVDEGVELKQVETAIRPISESALPSDALFGDLDGESETARTSTELRLAVQELLKHGYIEESDKRDAFQRIVRHERGINQALEPLDFKVKIDSHRGVAILTLLRDTCLDSEDEGWAHPLVRKQRLTLEQSLLVAILRHAFVLHEQESGVGHSEAKLAVDDVMPQLFAYLGDSGSDSKNESRVLQLLDQLKSYGIVSELDKNNEFTIRPLIAYLANPSSLEALLQSMRKQINGPNSELIAADE